MVLDLNAILIFSRVVQEGSFTAAGRTLEIPKSTVSRKVSDLEDRLGARLLYRTTRKLSLTDAGRTFYAYASRIADEVTAAEDAVTRLSEVPSGQLRVTAPLDLPFLGDLCAAYLARYPDVELDLVCTDRVVNLVEEGFDVALRVGPLRDSRMIARKLATWHGVIAASPTYLESSEKPRQPSDLAKHPAILFAPHAGRGGWELSSGQKQTNVDVTPRMICNEYAAIEDAVVAGLGMAILPVFRCVQYFRTGSLIRVLPEWSAPGAAFYAVYPGRRNLLPSVRTFVDHLRTALSPPPWDST